MRMIVSHRSVRRIALVPIGALLVGAFAVPMPVARAAPATLTAYVVNSWSNDVTPIDVATGIAGSSIPVGEYPWGIAITPDGTTVYVTNYFDDTVTPIDVATGMPGDPIPVGPGPQGIAITPDGTTAYVANNSSDSMTPIDVATNMPGSSIYVGETPGDIAITPDGSTAYVTLWGNAELVPVDLATNTAEARIHLLGSTIADDVVITPDGTTAYVNDWFGHRITRIDLATGAPDGSHFLGIPYGLAVTPDGSTLYVAGAFGVNPIDIATNTLGSQIDVAGQASAIAISSDGAIAYVVGEGSDTVTPIDLATGTTGTPIVAGSNTIAVAFTPAPPRHPHPPQPPRLTFGFGASTEGHGRIRSVPAGINCGRICGALFEKGATITFRAIPRDGWRLARWRYACSGHRRVCTLEMSRDRQVRAIFVRR